MQCILHQGYRMKLYTNENASYLTNNIVPNGGPRPNCGLFSTFYWAAQHLLWTVFAAPVARAQTYCRLLRARFKISGAPGLFSHWGPCDIIMFSQPRYALFVKNSLPFVITQQVNSPVCRLRMWINFHISIQNCERSPYEVFWLNSSLVM